MFNECRHIMPSGRKCHSPAIQDTPFCYFHAGIHRLTAPDRPMLAPVKIPPLEDSSAVQIALTDVLSALVTRGLDVRRAGLLLYGLQIAARFTAKSSAPLSNRHVRSVSCQDNGDTLAPEKTVCEPPEDCHTCAKFGTCKDEMRYDPDDESDD
jgi:hypothetical protein